MSAIQESSLSQFHLALKSLLSMSLIVASACTEAVRRPQDADASTDSASSPADKGDDGVATDSGAATAGAETSAGADGTASGPDSNDSATSPQHPPESCEEGQVRACREDERGVPIEFPGGHPRGSCREGTSVCASGVWGPCRGAVAPRPSDTCAPGNDDNCNGRPMDHCKCQPGETAVCGSNQGACRQGTMTCQSNGHWGACLGHIDPSAERCDGLGVDEDCDGLADLEDSNCACLEGQVEACALGGEGDCALGVRSCLVGGSLSTCSPRFPAQQEACGVASDGLEATLGRATGDEDCDGRVDESDLAQASPAGCQIYMVDEDRDGYGAVGENIASGISPATWGCLCPGAQPPGWISGTSERTSKDCGDCVDGGDLVAPRADAPFHPQPSACLLSIGYPRPFDYDCDGREQQEFVGEVSCVQAGGGCVMEGYWGPRDPETPGCGEEGDPLGKGAECAFQEHECRLSVLGQPRAIQRCK